MATIQQTLPSTQRARYFRSMALDLYEAQIEANLLAQCTAADRHAVSVLDTSIEERRMLSARTAAEGPFSVVSACFHTWVKSAPQLEFSDGATLGFAGKAWGLGVGGGSVWMTGYLPPPHSLLGDLHFKVINQGATTQVAFYAKGRWSGVLVGCGLYAQLRKLLGQGAFAPL